jgi:hypothetical protein
VQPAAASSAVHAERQAVHIAGGDFIDAQSLASAVVHLADAGGPGAGGPGGGGCGPGCTPTQYAASFAAVQPAAARTDFQADRQALHLVGGVFIDAQSLSSAVAHLADAGGPGAGGPGGGPGPAAQ